MANTRKRIAMEPSSGNVFADIGLPNAQERQAKARLAFEINEIIRGKRLTQAETACRLNIGRATVLRLLNYRLKGFSIQRLRKFLAALRRDR